MKPGLEERKRVRSAGMAPEAKAGCKWEAVRDTSGKRKRCKQEAAGDNRKAVSKEQQEGSNK